MELSNVVGAKVGIGGLKELLPIVEIVGIVSVDVIG